MEEAILSLLRNNSAVAAIVGTRVSWASRPTSDLPAISLHRVAGRRETAMSGPVGLVESIVQVDCWAGSYGGAKTLARAVITALPYARTTVGAVVLQGLFVTDESDSFEGENPFPLYRTRLDFTVWHTGD